MCFDKMYVLCLLLCNVSVFDVHFVILIVYLCCIIIMYLGVNLNIHGGVVSLVV